MTVSPPTLAAWRKLAEEAMPISFVLSNGDPSSAGQFYATARTAVPALIDEVERLTAAWKRVGNVLASNGCDCDENEPDERCLAHRIEHAWRDGP